MPVPLRGSVGLYIMCEETSRDVTLFRLLLSVCSQCASEQMLRLVRKWR